MVIVKSEEVSDVNGQVQKTTTFEVTKYLDEAAVQALIAKLKDYADTELSGD